MKRRVLCAALLVCMLLTGCAAKNSTQADFACFDEPFQLTADFTRDALSGSFLYTRNSSESCSLEYLAPQTLVGMRLTDQAGVVQTEFLGITHEQERSELKDGNPLRAVSRALDAFKSEQPQGRQRSNDEIEYTLSYGARVVFFAGQLRRIECPSEELIIEITGFDYLDEVKEVSPE